MFIFSITGIVTVETPMENMVLDRNMSVTLHVGATVQKRAVHLWGIASFWQVCTWLRLLSHLFNLNKYTFINIYNHT